MARLYSGEMYNTYRDLYSRIIEDDCSRLGMRDLDICSKDNDVLKVKKIGVSDKIVKYKIIYQDYSVLPRADFEDEELNIYSSSAPEVYNDDDMTIYLRGEYCELDDSVLWVDINKEDIFLYKIRKLNEKYSKKENKEISNKKGEDNMNKGLNLNLESMFGRIGKVEEIRYTMSGKICFPDKEGNYYSYENGSLINNMNLTMDAMGGVAFPVPRNSIKEGDLVIIRGKYAFACGDGYFVNSSGARVRFADVKNIITGSQQMITKVTGFFDMNGDGMGMNPMMLMALSGEKEGLDKSTLMMMAMSGMNGGNPMAMNPMMMMAMSGNIDPMVLMMMSGMGNMGNMFNPMQGTQMSEPCVEPEKPKRGRPRKTTTK